MSIIHLSLDAHYSSLVGCPLFISRWMFTIHFSLDVHYSSENQKPSEPLPLISR